MARTSVTESTSYADYISWNGLLIITLVIITAVTFNFMRKKRKKQKKVEIPKEEPITEKVLPLIKDLHHSTLVPHFLKSWKRIKNRLRNFVIDAFLISKYRDEWGKYKYWDYQFPQRPGRRRHKKIKNKVDPIKDIFEEYSSSSLLFHCRTSNPDTSPFPLEERHSGPVAHDHSQCQRIVINVCGLKFETQIRTLSRFPKTLLGNSEKRMRYFNPETNEYFFDRHRPSFEAIMYYYQSGGVLRCSNGIHVDIFFEELEFFEIDEEAIEKLKETEGLAADEDKEMPASLLKRKLWLLMEYPESSIQAKVVAILSIFTIVVSIYSFCMETTSEFSFGDQRGSRVPLGSRPLHYEDNVESHDIYDPVFFLETVCVCWFVFEVLMRALVCPNFLGFATDIMNIIDAIAIMPYILGIITQMVNPEDEGGNTGSSGKKTSGKGGASSSLAVFRVIRLVRIFRIFKLSRHSKGLKVLGRTLKASLRELGMLVFFLIIGIVLFSSALYFAELGIPETKFVSIPSSFWFAVVTMTTVGFGDEVPVGVLGKVIGGLCAVTGVLTISLPVPVIVSNFNSFYQRESYVGQLERGNESDDGLSWKINFLNQCPNRSGQTYVLKKRKKLTKRHHHYLQRQYLEARKSLMDETESDEEFTALKYGSNPRESLTNTNKKNKRKNK